MIVLASYYYNEIYEAINYKEKQAIFVDNSKAFQTEWLYYLGLTVKEGIHRGNAYEVTTNFLNQQQRKAKETKVLQSLLGDDLVS